MGQFIVLTFSNSVSEKEEGIVQLIKTISHLSSELDKNEMHKAWVIYFWILIRNPDLQLQPRTDPVILQPGPAAPCHRRTTGEDPCQDVNQPEQVHNTDNLAPIVASTLISISFDTVIHPLCRSGNIQLGSFQHPSQHKLQFAVKCWVFLNTKITVDIKKTMKWNV